MISRYIGQGRVRNLYENDTWERGKGKGNRGKGDRGIGKGA